MELIETYEKTGKWGTLGFKLVNSTLSNLVAHAFSARSFHCEGGYVHDLRLVKFDPEREPWRLQHSVDRNGNLYPDHPSCALMPSMDINHGDRFDYLVSVSSKAVTLNQYAICFTDPSIPYAYKPMKQGDYNCTLLRTVNGKVYTLNFDTNTPHPRGFYRVKEPRCLLSRRQQPRAARVHRRRESEAHKWEPAEKYLKQYQHPIEKAYQPKERKSIRGHGSGRSTPLSWHRLILALNEGRTTDFDIYDSVTSSAIIPLTERSVARGEPVDFPDFTRGKWKTRPPVEAAFGAAREA